MSSLSIEERFTLDAPPGVVWSLLTDPERVVDCLPGAELTGQEDERTYEGSVKVSAGPVTVAYKGTAVFEEVDDERRYVRIVGRGRERSGSGNVSMTMESRVEDADGGGTAVSVTADVQVTGKIVRFGRGMIQSVSAEMFADFTKRLEERVQAGSAGHALGGPESADAGEEGRDGPADGPPDASGRTAAVAQEGRENAKGGAGESAADVDDSPDEPAASTSSSDDSLALLPLLWRAFKRWLRGLLGSS